jgi:hypothetical protein
MRALFGPCDCGRPGRLYGSSFYLCQRCHAYQAHMHPRRKPTPPRRPPLIEGLHDIAAWDRSFRRFWSLRGHTPARWT